MKKIYLILTLTSLSFINAQTLFFSEYAEGSANNKYLEIYNPTSEAIDLTQYSYPNVSNGPTTPGEPEFWNTFEPGAEIAAGDVYIIAHPSADTSILNLADETHSYLSNGNDGYALVLGTDATTFEAGGSVILDVIGQSIFDNDYADPGSGWSVAGISNATQNKTLVRKSSVTSGNAGDWATSAGTNPDDSQWVVKDQDTWDYLGYGGEEASANPSLGIDSPSDGDFISGTDVDISLTVQNFTVGALGSGADGHIHYTIDGGSTTMKYDTNPISLSGLSYGEHTVTLELVDDNHTSLDPAVTSSLTFTMYKEQTLPFSEDFNYSDGGLSSSDNWSVFSGNEYDIDVVSGKIEVKHAAGSGKDLFVSIPTVSGALYYAFDMSLVDPGTGPISGTDFEYFAIFKDNDFAYRARIYVVPPSATGDYTLGISTLGSTADTTWASDLTYGQSYRVTVMYDQAANIAKLWVDASAETDTSITGDDETDPGTSITQFAFRQSTSSVNETIIIDNLNIGQTFNSTLSSDDRLQTLNFNIYPNPVENNLNFSGLTSSVQASVFDMLGKLHLQTEVTNTLDVSGLKSGLYMVEIKNETSSKVFKMLKQ